MQIHEITKRPLQEGVLGNIGRGLASGLTGVDIPQSQASIDRDAAAAAEKLRAQGYGQPLKLPSVQDAVADVQKNPAQQQYIKGLVAQWSKQAPKAQATPSVAQTPSTPPTTPTQTKPAPGTQVRPTYGKPGGPTVSFAGQKQKPLDPRNPADAKILAQLQSQGKLNEAPQEYTTPGGIVVPGGTKTDTNPATPTAAPISGTDYKQTFLQWAAEKLRTVEPSTRQTITLDQIEKTDMADELDRALAQVVATARDPQKNAVAVNNYLTIAVAGVARESKKLKMNYGRGGEAKAVSTPQAGQGIVTQQEIRNKLAQEVGLNATQFDALKKLAQDPSARQALLKSFGVQA